MTTTDQQRNDSMTFETHGVLSAATGILMGDIAGVYAVASFLLGRSAYTHELSFYGYQMQEALMIAHPNLPTEATIENWQQVRDTYTAQHGATMELDPALKGILADDRDPITTLHEMVLARQVSQ